MDSTFPTFPRFHFSTFPQKFHAGPGTSKSSTALSHFPKVPWDWHGNLSKRCSDFHFSDSWKVKSFQKFHGQPPTRSTGPQISNFQVLIFPIFRLKSEVAPKVPRNPKKKVNRSSDFQFSDSWKVKSLQKFHGNPSKESYRFSKVQRGNQKFHDFTFQHVFIEKWECRSIHVCPVARIHSRYPGTRCPLLGAPIPSRRSSLDRVAVRLGLAPGLSKYRLV